MMRLIQTTLFIYTLTIFLAISEPVLGQTTGVRGIITDYSTGSPLEGANIAMREVNGDGLRGISTDQNGFYQITGFQPGEYNIRISFVGYVTYDDTLYLEPGEIQTISRALEQVDEQLDMVIVSPPGSGAAGITAGRQRIEAADFRRVPAPAASGDLASYLQALPGVVVSGDRGGHLYIRGGTPAENMILVDGTLIFQPFHILGFFSAFPENLVSEADFYAGGFGARYAGRTSSVIDVKMKNGDRYSSGGSASLSPFLGEVMAEGPVKTGKSSWIASVRHSLIEHTSPWFLGQENPLHFESQFLKFTHFGESDTRCSASIMRTYDRGKLDMNLDEVVRWSNFISGGRCVILPEGANMLFDINAGVSFVSNATGSRNDPELSSDAMRVNLDINMTRHIKQIRFDYGAFVHIHSLNYDMREQFGGPQADSEHLTSTGIYTEFTLPFGNFTLIPGVTAITYVGDKFSSVEPRFRASWQPWGSDSEQLNLSIGRYTQTITGISGTRDASSVFTAWMSSPFDNSQIEATHALLGWRQTMRSKFQFSVEGYLKWIHNLPVSFWSHLARFTTELTPAKGNVTGLDIRLEYNSGKFYGFLGYGYSFTEFETSQPHFEEWFGVPQRKYHPPHDRRHQLNALASFDLDKYSVAVRWDFGSGLPFTQPMGFDELHSFKDQVPIVKLEYGDTRVILQDYYQGRMPVYHRLDFSLARSFDFEFGNIDVKAGAINVYDQVNIFYYDVFTHRRVDQLPFAPYFSFTLKIE